MLYNPEFDDSGIVLGTDEKPRKADARRWPFRRVLLWSLSILTLLFVALSGTLALLISASIELPFVRNQVDATIEQALGEGYNATVGSAILDVDPVLGLVLRVADVSVVDGAGTEVARVPSAMIAISLSGIVTSRNAVRSVEADGAWFAIRRDGGVAFLGNNATTSTEFGLEGVATPAEDVPVDATPLPAGDAAAMAETGDAFARLSNPIEAIERSLEEVMALAERGFDRIGLYNATVELWNGEDAAPHLFERADVQFVAHPEDGQLSATMTASGHSGRWSVTADRAVSPLTGARTLTLRFSQMTLADFFPAVGRGPSLVTTNIPFYGQAIVNLDSDGRVAGAAARLDLGAGYFAFGPNAQPILLDEASVRLAWSVANSVIRVEPSIFVAGNGGATITGEIRPVGSDAFAFDLQSSDAVLAPADSPAPPLFVERLRLAGSLDLATGLINLDRASIITPQGSLVAAGSIGLEPNGPSIALMATLDEMPISVFKQLWPPGLEDGGRSWLLEYVTEGTVAGTFAAEIPAGVLAGGEITSDMLRMELSLRDVSFNTFESFPPVVAASGRAVLAGTHFAVDLDGGAILAPNGETLLINAATFVIGQATAAVPTAHIEVSASGPTSAFAAVADQDPINALQQFGVPADAIAGSGTALMSAHWPLVEGLTIGEVEWRIGLTVTDLASEVPFEGMLITDGDVVLDVTPTVVSVAGVATIDGVAANIDLEIPLTEELEGRQQLRMVLDEEARERLGFNLQGFLGGIVHATVNDLGAEGEGQHYDLDLTQARVALAPLGWTKPIGVPATMVFDLVTLEDGQEIRNLRLDGDGFGFIGTVELGENGAIARAEITDFALRPEDSVRFTFEQDGAGWAIEATGETFDVRGLISEGFGEMDGTGGITDISIHGLFDELIGFNGERIQDAEITLVSVDGVVERVNVSGTLQGAPVIGTFEPGPAGTRLYVYVGNAGALMRFADIYARAHGGELVVNGGVLDDGAVYGEIAITAFDVRDEPGVSRFMAPTGTPPESIPASVQFERLEFDFVQRGSVVTIQDALVRGGDMGAVGAGWLDLGAGRISISGTYIPQYTVNNIFGRIPLFGLALGGGPNEGLFGMTFQLSGLMSDPQLQVNPLSVIAPGIFRKIFQFQ